MGLGSEPPPEIENLFLCLGHEPFAPPEVA